MGLCLAHHYKMISLVLRGRRETTEHGRLIRAIRHCDRCD